jgi:hypothetical protein
VAACLAGLEKVTIALPGPVLEENGVGIVIPLKGHRESLNVNALALFCVALGFLSLTNHA